MVGDGSATIATLPVKVSANSANTIGQVLDRATIKDDRGRRVILAPIPATLGARGLERDVRDRLGGRRPFRLTRRQHVQFGLAALPVILVLGLVPVALTSWIKAPLWVVIPAGALSGLVPAVVTIFLMRRIAGEQIAERYREACACASCGYELRGVPVEGDGCRVCPECGAAWRAVDGST